MSDIFISYARQDRSTAQLLAAMLGRAGYSVFWDRDLLAGEDFEQELSRELTAARAVIVLWSTVSVRSGWVRDEAAAAMERGVLVPMQLNGTPAPMGFRSLHVIPLDVGEPAELLRAIVRLTTKEPRTVPFPVRKATGMGWVEVASLLIMATAVAAFVLMRWH